MRDSVQAEPRLGRRGWVLVRGINSCKRERERSLLEAEPAIVSGDAFAVAHRGLIPR